MKTHHTLFERLRIDVDRVFSSNASRNLTDQFDATLLRAQYAVRICAAFKPARRFGVHAELTRGLSD